MPLRALLLLLVLLLPATAAAEPARLDPEEAHRRAVAGEVLLIDVRSPAEWQETAVPQGAQPITMHRRGGLPAFAEAVLAAAGGDRSRSIALICASGTRSALAQRFLANDGFRSVADVPAGVLGRAGTPGWLQRGLPTDPCPSC